ncbi:hypothetical protein E4U53_005483 [Claviceps sorghi]|nr:hypothetical protein E4U53_005483 [Claviceps sorghi]
MALMRDMLIQQVNILPTEAELGGCAILVCGSLVTMAMLAELEKNQHLTKTAYFGAGNVDEEVMSMLPGHLENPVLAGQRE